jgi:hypothetical protein
MSETKEQGLSLYDIANFGEDVEVGNGQKLRVKGISAQGCLVLLMRYPDFQKWIGGKALQLSDVMLLAPDVIAAVIAAGTGKPGDVDAEDIAGSLPVETQTDLVEAIYRQTFRSGFGPFALRVLKLYEGARASGNFGGDPAMKSPPVSKPSSQPADTPLPTFGDTPPGK